MRVFKCNFDFSKSTDQKLRWDEDIDGTKFELYIPKWRVPEPTPAIVSVKIYDASSFDPEQQFTPSQKIQLSEAGLPDDQIRELDTWLPATRNAEPHSDRPIIAAVEFDRIHTQTVRYQPTGDPERWEIGQPYVPISVLLFPYPRRLILLVTWTY
jgi:hypothetical protein